MFSRLAPHAIGHAASKPLLFSYLSPTVLLNVSKYHPWREFVPARQEADGDSNRLSNQAVS